MQDSEEFVNRSQGWVGVTRLNRKNDEFSDVVEPGGRVFLSTEEQQLTERAHRRREDSPFVEREITHFDPLTHDIIATFTAPLLQRASELDAAESEPESEPERPRRRREPVGT